MSQPSSPRALWLPVVTVLTALSAFHRPPSLLAFVDRPIELDLLGAADSTLKCRSGASKAMLLGLYGGNAKSERAVAGGLAWIVAHQLPDGGWSFDHTQAPGCLGKCPNPGSLATGRNAATAMALLPLLGAGHTHQAGPHKDAVKKGLQLLVSQMKVGPSGGSLHEQGGTMYAHGLASIALCEAYAMTRDKKLKGPAQRAVDFIANAQDPFGGGWRYFPRQKGDTSVFGWQMAALRCAQLAGLKVPRTTLQNAHAFLDTVQADAGATYGYLGPGAGQATTAIGLLGRMHQGWKKDNPALVRGVDRLTAWGPSPGNMYYDYYAGQILRAHGRDAWKKWNTQVRDALIDAQVTDGHAKGSWHVARGDYGSQRGGRLYCTSMAVLLLEVYYRYPPLHGPIAPPSRSRPGVLEVRPQ